MFEVTTRSDNPTHGDTSSDPAATKLVPVFVTEQSVFKLCRHVCRRSADLGSPSGCDNGVLGRLRLDGLRYRHSGRNRAVLAGAEGPANPSHDPGGDLCSLERGCSLGSGSRHRQAAPRIAMA